jgi:hypothetical protein
MSLATWEHKPSTAPNNALAAADTASDAVHGAHDSSSCSASGAQSTVAHETEALHSTDELEDIKVSFPYQINQHANHIGGLLLTITSYAIVCQ